MKLSKAQQVLLVVLAECAGGTELHKREEPTALVLARMGLVELVADRKSKGATLTTEGWRRAYILLNARHATLLSIMREVADANEYLTGSIANEAIAKDEALRRGES
jgi:hypothetical protein